MKTASMTVKKNELYVGEHKLTDLAKEFKTPLYVYDEFGVRKKIEIFNKYFQSDMFNTMVVYASKAFIAPYLCDILKEYGFGIDAVSGGDLYLLEKSKFTMDKVVFHGNYKSNEELEDSVRLGVRYIVVDNLRELKRLEKIAEKAQKKVSTLFRVNPGIDAHTHEYIQTSLLSSKFGESIYDEEILNKITDVYKNSKYLELKGFHCHIGSQINTFKSFVNAAKVMLDFVNKFVEKTGFEINTLNLGGGFGIKYLDKDVPIKLPEMLTRIIKTVEGYIKLNGLNINELIIEPGRSFIGDSGFTLYTCGGSKKTYGGKTYVFVDGGMTDNIRPALYQAKYTVGIANNVVSSKGINCDVVGKCCESGDIIAKDITLGEAHEGDTIIVYSTGAYCYSMSSNYNGAVRGAVIFVNGGKVTEAIKRQDYENLISTYNFLGGKSS